MRAVELLVCHEGLHSANCKANTDKHYKITNVDDMTCAKCRDQYATDVKKSKILHEV